MPDFDDPDEDEWLPPSRRPAVASWPGIGRRVGQVVVLHAVVGGAVGFALWAGASAPTAGRFALCIAPALVLGWLGFAAYLLASTAGSRGVPPEGGRLLVVGLDVLTAVAAVFGAFVGLAVVTR